MVTLGRGTNTEVLWVRLWGPNMRSRLRFRFSTFTFIVWAAVSLARWSDNLKRRTV